MQKNVVKNMLSNKKGFTLMELIIVITILAILVTLALLYYGNLTDDARRAALLADLNAVDKAVALYESQYNKLPTVGISVTLEEAAEEVDNAEELPTVLTEELSPQAVHLRQINPADPNLMNFIKKTSYLLKPGSEAGNARGAGKVYIVEDTPVLESGIVANSDADSIDLDELAAADYSGAIIYITKGTGAGQSRTIKDSTAGNATITVDRPWDIEPEAAGDEATESHYEIYAPVKKGDIVFFQTARDDELKIYTDSTATQLIYKY